MIIAATGGEWALLPLRLSSRRSYEGRVNHAGGALFRRRLPEAPCRARWETGARSFVDLLTTMPLRIIDALGMHEPAADAGNLIESMIFYEQARPLPTPNGFVHLEGNCSRTGLVLAPCWKVGASWTRDTAQVLAEQLAAVPEMRNDKCMKQHYQGRERQSELRSLPCRSCSR